MPISADYTYAKTALINLGAISGSLNKVKATMIRIQQLDAAVLSVEENAAIIQSYKTSMKNLIQNRINEANAQALVLALASACESDSKNGFLTPIIAGIPVNPATGPNLVELNLMLIDGANTLIQLTDFINQSNQILS